MKCVTASSFRISNYILELGAKEFIKPGKSLGVQVTVTSASCHTLSRNLSQKE